MADTVIKKVDERALVRQSNELVEANYKLTLAEQKVILNFIAQIDTTRENFTVNRINAKSLSDACGFNAKSGYWQLQDVIKKLLTRSIILQHRDGSGWYGSHWVQSCEYVTGKDGDSDCAYVEFKLDERLCPHFLQLRERFLKSDLKSLIAFSHVYSTRFYMIFKNRIKIGHARFTFQELCKILELPQSYQKKTTDLKSRVIKVAVEEINEKADITVEYAYYKQGGRAHVGVDFTFYEKSKQKAVPISERPAQSEELDDEAQKMLARLMNPDRWNVTEKMARQLIKDYPLSLLDANLRYAYKYRKNKTSLGGWLISCIRNDEAGREQARVAAKKAEEKRQHEKAAEAADLKHGIFAEPDEAAKRVETTYEILDNAVKESNELGTYTILQVKKYLSDGMDEKAEKLLQMHQLTLSAFREKYLPEDKSK
ncbi:replication initiation protein [Mitsuokella sp. WILCCON 0060]|uniref:replication initiation protein n=1 Tax=unclassified Mitsuokella TaxID=2637239 RepID=UPI003F0F5A4C